jgi:uncharacterized iron-regulated membrane protein
MRAFLRVAHRYLGLVLALPMLWQGVTGCFLAITPIWEALRLEPVISAGPPQPASAILAAALAAKPEMAAVRYQPGEPEHAAAVDLAPAGQRFPAVELLIDPASLAVLETRYPSATYRWVHSLHENLLIPQFSGRSVVGWFGVGLCLLGLSGLVIWWPAALMPNRWRRAMTVSGSAKGARFQRELHGAFGFWFSAMMVLMSISGVSVAWPQTLREMLGAGGPPAREAGGPGRGGEAFNIDAVLARANAAIPGATVVDMRLSNPPGRPVNVRLEINDALTGTPAATATIDPAGKRVLSVQDPRTEPVGLLAIGWLRSLHFGEAFGLPWRLLVLATGIVLPTLAVTGATLWLLKRRNRLRLAGQRRAAIEGAAD